MNVVIERCAGLDVHKNPHGHAGGWPPRSAETMLPPGAEVVRSMVPGARTRT